MFSKSSLFDKINLELVKNAIYICTRKTTRKTSVKMETEIKAPIVEKEWVKNTWAKKVRAMKVGDELPVGSTKLHVRNNRYSGAKKAFPNAKFTVTRNTEGKHVVRRIA